MYVSGAGKAAAGPGVGAIEVEANNIVIDVGRSMGI